jgi:hypothetical protein
MVDVIVDIMVDIIIDVIVDVIVNYIYPIFTKLGWVFKVRSKN